MPILLVLRVMSPVVHINIGRIRANRIGHLALDLEIEFCRRKVGKNSKVFPKNINLFFCDYPISNQFLMYLWSKKIKIYPKFFLNLLDIGIKEIKLFSTHNFFHFVSSFGHRNLTMLDSCEATLDLTEEMLQKGKVLLQKFGLSLDQKFICLAVRDEKYLNEHMPDYDWTYSNFRNSKIEDYLLMSEYFANKGFAVLRMGKYVQEEFKSPNPLVIDYANSNFRSDFGDVFLFAKCFFCISTSTGMDALASIFRRPIGLVNIVNIDSVGLGNNIKLFQPKDFFDLNLNRSLKLNEIIDRNLFSLSSQYQFKKNNIVLIDNTKEELLSFGSTMLNWALKNFSNSQFDSKKFRNIESKSTVGKISKNWVDSHIGYLL